jgi:hypothetical protein
MRAFLPLRQQSLSLPINLPFLLALLPLEHRNDGSSLSYFGASVRVARS